MKLISAIIISVVFVICILVFACSGVRPLQKGETIRCPSCGAEFTVEQGQKAKEKAQ
jgi:DNA-directed RNA polymerase subunit RPC12/RpoP